MTSAIVTTEAPTGPFLLSLYADHGLAGGGVELSAVAALHLALTC